MEHKPPLLFGGYYHIYNRGINKSPLCIEKSDFLKLLDTLRIYTQFVADTYSYAIMMNHFHLAVRIKSEEEIGYLVPENIDEVNPEEKWRTFLPNPQESYRKLSKPVPDKMFAHAFNAYTKWFNNKYGRSGRLFEARFERKVVTSQTHLRQLIVYINSNPTHHGVVKSHEQYLWSSFNALIQGDSDWLDQDYVLGLFDNIATFQAAMSGMDFDTLLYLTDNARGFR